MFRISGLSPFMGDTDSETLSNVTRTQWDFEDEAFDDISASAQDFISRLLVHRLEYVFPTWRYAQQSLSAD